MKKLMRYTTKIILSSWLAFSLFAGGLSAYATEMHSQEVTLYDEAANPFEIWISDKNGTETVKDILLEPKQNLDLGNLNEGYVCEAAGQLIKIRNTGTEAFELTFTFDETEPCFDVVCEHANLQPGEETDVRINPMSGLPVGEYAEALQISAESRTVSSSQTVTLSFQVLSTAETDGVAEIDEEIEKQVILQRDEETPSETVAEDAASNVASVTETSELLNATANDTVVSQSVSINSAAVTGIVNKTCTGKEVTQDIEVRLSGKALKAGTDYTVGYTDNIKPGTAKIVITGKGAYSGKITKTFKLTCATPTISSVSNDNCGVTVTWKTVPCAEKYQILKKTGTGNWTKLAETTSLSYKDKAVMFKRKYTYTVRCISSNGKQITSDYDQTGKSVRYYATPLISSLTGSDEGVTITWNRTDKMMKYRIFRKTGSEDWVTLADTSLVRYTDKTTKPGNQYTYAVRCISNDGKQYLSGFSSAGKTIYYTLSVPQGKITKVTSGVKNYTVKFQAIQNVKGYQVRYSLNPDMSNSVVKTLTANQTSLKVTNASEGIYFVQVRAYKQDDKGNLIYGKWSPAKLAKFVRYQSEISEAELEKIIAGAQTNQSKKAILYAFSRVGYPYSQIYRSSGNYYDCSSLVYYAWKSAGIELTPGKVGTAADEAQALQDKIISKSQLVPGSLVFFSGWTNGRYKNITHVVMYVGNGMAVEAANSKIGVVYRPLDFDGRGTTVVCCNPVK